jgi:hypothetical protein
MKKISTAVLFGLLLTAFIGCSSTPEGTVAIKDLQQNIEQRIGQKVVVVGLVDTSVGGMSITGLFRLYRGNDAVWASIPEGGSEPPQGVRVRVTGVVAEDDFPAGIGKRVYIESQSIMME